MKLFSTLSLATVLVLSAPAFADGHTEWKSVADQSSIAFGSVKKNVVGEVHHFENVTGSVSEKGELKITIDLRSVQTNIDIRNERMAKHVFVDAAAPATLSGTIDMAALDELKPGDTALVDLEAKLSFIGVENDIEAEMLVARLSDNRVLVTTADFIMLSTEDLGINAGIDKLMQLAKLPGITRVAPVSVRMVFEK